MLILSLNGGGTCGYMSAALLAKAEAEIGSLSSEIFKLVSGVSTGAIIAGAIGCGISASMIMKLYKELASDIFGHKNWCPWKSWYSADKLEASVKGLLDYQFNTARTKIMIHAAGINGPDVLKPKFWKSWKECDTLKTNDIVVASCSAPIYFPPKVIDQNVYIDGGFVSNNPSTCALVEALRLNIELSDIRLLNINCGEQKGFDKAQKLDSILKWIPKISSLPTLAIRTGERSVAYQAATLLGPRYVEIGPSVDLPMDTLDFGIMDKAVEKMWAEYGEQIISLLKGKK
jgi:patatin-like phospholipase/acyl hydrolase